MKTIFAVAALAVISLGVANSAVAGNYRFKDTGGFTATGSLMVTAAAVSLPCTAVLTGSTDDRASVTGATFTGLSCLLLVAANLPWKMYANAPHGFTMKGVEVSAAVLGICGPGKIKAQLNQAGVIAVSGAGLPGLAPCSVEASFTTSPKLVIVARK